MRANNAIVGETFHRGYMASAVGLYTAYLAATGEIKPSELPQEKRDSLFELSCVTPDTLADFSGYDAADGPDKFVDSLIENGPWDTAPMKLVGGGPEVLPRQLIPRPSRPARREGLLHPPRRRSRNDRHLPPAPAADHHHGPHERTADRATHALHGWGEPWRS